MKIEIFQLEEIISGIIVAIIMLALTYLYHRIKEYIKFRPYEEVWRNFKSSNTYIVMTGRRYGDTIKISFNEFISARKIQKILGCLKSDECLIHSYDENIDCLKDNNIIVLGAEQMNPIAKDIMNNIKNNLHCNYTNDNDIIIDNIAYKSVFSNNILTTDYALIIKTTNPYNPQKTAFLFAGNHGLGTQAAIEILTEKSQLKKALTEFHESHFYMIIECVFNKRFPKKPTSVRILKRCLLDSAHNTSSMHSFKKIDDLMVKLGANNELINHSINVASLAKNIAQMIENRGTNLDMDAVYFGAMLHDIGKIKSDKIDHGKIGAELLDSIKEQLLTDFFLSKNTYNKILECIECHILGGMDKEWISKNIPTLSNEDFTPITLEAKIVIYSHMLLIRKEKKEYTPISFNNKYIANFNNLNEEISLSLFKNELSANN